MFASYMANCDIETPFFGNGGEYKETTVYFHVVHG